uniref:Uncharacterized protein n=1 Tax=Rhodnius prolixus TaxID=13249 RepID=R4FJV9_RHOPR
MLSLKNWLNIISVRTYRKRFNPIKTNPGIDQRLQLYKEEQADLANVNLNEESLDNLEEDIYNSKDLHAFHTREVKKLQSKIQLKQLERKYFTTQKLPNMLLWSEKEQIRLLSQTDPDLWTPEKLSQSFPATPDIIAKILKSQWKPANKERIESHDSKVSANWAAFEAGKLNLPIDVSRHLKLFTSRKENSWREEENLPEKIEQRTGEFADIIRNYENTSNLAEYIDGSEIISPMITNRSDTYLLGKNPKPRRRMKEFTLEEMGKIRGEDFYPTLEKSNEEFKLVQGSMIENTFSKSCTNNVKNVEIEIANQSKNRFEEKISMKIEIPEEKRKKGCVYKINNCYYSDDGEFLYRV